MKKISLKDITYKGKALFLAYDQGLEHGPTDFNDKNIDPLYIIKLAKKAEFTSVVLQKGIVEKYREEIKKSKVPLLMKLNGKTDLYRGDPISAEICTVKEAIELGAKAVGFTIYIGSQHEDKMIEEFETIEREAHAKGLPVVAWIYARGSSVRVKPSDELMAYAARTGLEIGADIIKIKYDGDVSGLNWAVKSAGRTKVVIAGGMKKDDTLFLKQVGEIMNSGAIGLAVGRNIWQHENPYSITKKVKKIMWG
jgi:fructose-bisphosphate aldolase, class I